MPEAESMWQHWSLACKATHPMARPPELEPGLQQCLDIQDRIGGSISRLRTEVVDEIAIMAESFHDDTQSWWENLPPHIAKVYYNAEHSQISQIPLLLHLLRETGMPLLDALAQDLCEGFQVLGTLNPGAGWLPRAADQKYEFPISTESFKKNNRIYTLRRLQSKRVDPEWKTMLQELRAEVLKGRMSGPFAAPDWWPITSVSLNGESLLELPTQDLAFSFCFSVKQSDKIRRCEDFRRSGHNSTIEAHDVPCHHDITVFTEVALQNLHRGFRSSIWAQDLQGAYRQFPVRSPDDCFCVLMTPQGPLILKHHALMFGATSSVWNFNRAADSLMFLMQSTPPCCGSGTLCRRFCRRRSRPSGDRRL